MGKKSQARRKEKERKWKQRDRPTVSQRTSPPLAPWFVDRTIQCPCGTGKSFANCCGLLIHTPGHDAIPLQPDAPAPIAERHARAIFTRYVGWVFRHTVPALRLGLPFARQLSQVDVEALSDCVDGVAYAMRAQGRQLEVPAFFDHVAGVVPLAVFSERMLASKAVWFDAVLNDNKRATEVLSGVDPHTANDNQLIEATIAIREVRDPREGIRLMDRAIALTWDDRHRVWNLTTKALLQEVAEDPAGARNTLAKATVLASKHSIMQSDVMERLTTAKFFGVKWKLTGDESDFVEAMKWYESIDLSDFATSGRAELLHQVGTLRGDHGETRSAITQLEQAYELDRAVEVGVRLLELLVEDGQHAKAEVLSSELLPQVMSPGLRAEYLTGVAALSVRKGDEGGLRKTIDALRMLRIEVQYFAKQRDRTCEELLAELDGAMGDWRGVPTAGVLLKLLRGFCKVCEYLELKPNVYGVGINLNKVMERVDRAAAGRDGVRQDRVVRRPQSPG